MLQHTERKDVFEIVLQKMTDSGYDQSTREDVVKSAVRMHHQDLRSASDQRRPFNQTRQEKNKFVI